jgi:hypothetical protein
VKFIISVLLLFAACVSLAPAPKSAAQSFEIGGQVTGLHLHKIDEAPVGIGVRFHYNLTRLAAVDAELTHYPENPAGNFGETAALAGIRAGKKFSRIGVFAKARAGVMHFGGDYFTQQLNLRTRSIVDIGGIVEYYPSRRTFLRLEAGDTVIYFGAARLFNRPDPDALGTIHNFQPALGFGFRF